MDECLELVDECLELVNECLELADECLELADECLELADECLELADECLELADECLGFVNECLNFINESLKLVDEYFVPNLVSQWLKSRCLHMKAQAVDTATCPRCHQPVNSQAVTCPHCGNQLKAYGHPGIPLHRATGKEYLCDSCTYHADDTCNFPQRPFAKECILYENIEESKQELQQQRYANSFGATVRSWMRRNQALVLLLVLLFVCLMIALSTT
ncbi:hypothetical protein SAMD00079811_57870 [Scytonema sp. HK-05]|nr:hypothetical protein SAMD00079811_57870 [Scytonema sp. HK-05]